MWMLVLGCGEKELPSLLIELDGEWVGEVDVAVQPRELDATFRYDEDEDVLTGKVVVQDPDQDRAYDVLEGTSVEDFGVSVHLIERAGVRELFLDALSPLDPFEGWYSTRWYCEDEAGGFCIVEGPYLLERR